MNIKLLLEVRNAILSHPNNFCMRSWVKNPRIGEDKHTNVTVSLVTECGSTACIAGWAVALDTSTSHKPFAFGSIIRHAEKILGLTDIQGDQLFLEDDWAEISPELCEQINELPQTRSEAEIAADYIEAFILHYNQVSDTTIKTTISDLERQYDVPSVAQLLEHGLTMKPKEKP